MPGTRILLVNLPRLLAGVVRGLVAQYDDLHIVGEITSAALDEAVALTRADVVAVGVEEGSQTTSAASIRTRHGALRVLMIDVEGRHATMVEPDGHRQLVSELSPGTLLELFRGPMLQ